MNKSLRVAHKRLQFAIGAAVMLLAGCMDSSGTSDSQTAQTSSLSGVALDGYLRNAKVCLDVNGNLGCDATEPSTTTTQGGKYKLLIPEGQTTDKHHLVVEAIAGVTLDEDTGLVETSYRFLAPASVPDVISPTTTLVSHAMLDDQMDFASAIKIVQAQLQIDNALKDYKLHADAEMQNKATLIVTGLAQAEKSMGTALKAVSNATLTEKQMAQARLMQIKKTREVTQSLFQRLHITAIQTLKDTVKQDVTTALENDKSIQNAVFLPAQPASLAYILQQEGIYGLDSPTKQCANHMTCSVSLNKLFSPTATILQKSSYGLVNGEWQTNCQDFSVTTLNAQRTAWVEDKNNCGGNIQVTSDGRSILLVDPETDNATLLTALEVELGNVKLSSYFSDLYQFQDIKFPTGSKGYHIKSLRLSDVYSYGGEGLHHYNQGNSIAISSFEEMIDTYNGSGASTLDSPSVSFGILMGFTFGKNNQVYFYDNTTGPCPSFLCKGTLIGEGRYEIKNIAQKRVLQISGWPPNFLKSNYYYTYFPIFIESSGKVYNGQHLPIGPTEKDFAEPPFNAIGMKALFGVDNLP